MEAVSMLSRYNIEDALKMTQKRLDAALMGMQTLKTELKHVQESLKKERARNIGLTQRYNNLYQKHQQHLSGGKVSRRYRAGAIRRAICQYFGLSEIKPVGTGRGENERYPRQLYIYMAYTMTTATFEELAAELSANHTTIIASRTRIQSRIEADAPYDPVREDVEAIKAILSQGSAVTCTRKDIGIPSRGKAVERISETGEVLAEYPTMTIAATVTGISPTSIYDIIHGYTKQSKHGIWRYKNNK